MTPTYDVCIIGGCGHVGLPLGIAFARAGRRVVLYDVDHAALERVGQGQMPFRDAGADEALRAVVGRSLSVSADPAVVGESACAVAATGTPVDTHLNPDLAGLERMLDEVASHLCDGQLFVLRSTVYPGVTERVAHLLASRGKNVAVAFCPERVAEGRALEEICALPQIVAGIDADATRRAKDLFAALSPTIIELTPREAELAKLFTNSWRYVNFAVANQFYMLATAFGLDFYRIYDAMMRDYPRMRGFPRAGFTAGPCLFKDTMQLGAFSDNNFFLGHAAMLVNEGLPSFLVNKIREAYPLQRMTVGILGMAFKADSDDRRESLSYKLRKVLSLHARRVVCSDPFVDDESLVSVEELLSEADLVVVGAPHTQYRDLAVEKHAVIDVWNLFGRGSGL